MARDATGSIPQGIEVLVKKASVDAEFKEVLLAERDAAAKRIGLSLDPAEAMMLQVIPLTQLDVMVAQTAVPREQRRAFLGTAAAVMLAALGVTAVGGCSRFLGTSSLGVRPDLPRAPRVKKGGDRQPDTKNTTPAEDPEVEDEPED